MKCFILFAAITFCPLILLAQDSNPNFDKKLADSLGADQYGMKMYTMVILKTGTGKVDDKARRDSIFDPEIFQWYGSAAIPVYLPYHDKVWTKKP